MQSVDYIITAKHYAEREGAGGSVKKRILKWREKMHKNKGEAVQVKGIDAPSGEVVQARIWQGQWIAECECGGNEFVDPDEPIFFCFSCGNRKNDQYVRPVVFPENHKDIEAAVLARPVNDMRGITDLERAGLAAPLLYVETEEGEIKPLTRSWSPGETLADLHKQNHVIKKWHDELKKGNGLEVKHGIR